MGVFCLVSHVIVGCLPYPPCSQVIADFCKGLEEYTDNSLQCVVVKETTPSQSVDCFIFFSKPLAFVPACFLVFRLKALV